MPSTQPFISEQDVQDALDYLDSSADAAAEARADKSHLEDYLKSLEALLMKESDDGSTSAVIQKRNALCHPDYLKFLQAKKEAIKRDAKCQYLRESARARIDAYKAASYRV